MPGLRSLDHQWFADPQAVYEAVQAFGPVKYYRPLVAADKFFHFFGHQTINNVQLLSSGSVDIDFAFEDGAAIHLLACLQGERRFRAIGGEVHCTAGGCLLLPIGENRGRGSSSNVIVKLRPEAIAHAAAAMAGVRDGGSWRLSDWPRFKPQAWADGSTARQIHGLIHYIDACAAQDPALPATLALDDVLHRQVAVLLDPSLLLETPENGKTEEAFATRKGKTAFDDLIDYIRRNLDQPLRLSDLEMRSHYSRRALQYAFRQKLNCTPKQWIRQQRLVAAMERLRESEGSASVQAIALSCGYRSLSLFSLDFKQHFGCTPSRAQRAAL